MIDLLSHYFSDFCMSIKCANVLEHADINKHMAIFLYKSWDVFHTGWFCVHEIFLNIRGGLV